MSENWTDMQFGEAKGHPSTFEAECQRLRAENGALRRAFAILAKSADRMSAALEEIKEETGTSTRAWHIADTALKGGKP